MLKIQILLCACFLFSGVFCELKYTPFGFVPEECILEVPSGSQITETIIDDAPHAHVIHPDGTVKLHEQCNVTIKEKRADPYSWNGWPKHYWFGVDYAYFTNPALTSSVTSFHATWKVPAYPTNRTGNSQAPWKNQPTLSWWTGLQSPTFVNILQPVLEFNGLIANNYDLSSWNCCPAGYTFHSTPIPISPGQTINGTMDLVRPTDPYTYQIITAIVGGASTSLIANFSAQKPSYTWSEMKNEAYFITNCNQLPPKMNVTFNINKFTTAAGSVNAAPWKRGYSCEGGTCPGPAISPSCIGSTSSDQNVVSVAIL